MDRVIRVTGKGKIAVKPDTIRLLITLENVIKTYESALLDSAQQKDGLNAAFEKLGFARTDLKTLAFDVDTAYESYQDEDGDWKQRFKGYRYTHRLKIEFPTDNVLLGRILKQLSYQPGKPEFSIEYTIADQESVKNELLARAVDDARTKAQVLSSAAGVRLLEIQTIDYSWGEVDFVSQPMRNMMMPDAAQGTPESGIPLNIEADDIDVADTVTVVWSIE